VDCAATSHTIDALLLALRRGAGIALANKQPLCTHLSSFTTAISPLHRARFRYESTVGAGTPFVAALHRLLASNDPPHSIQGTFSGTLGFLCSGIGEGRRYSEVVADAVRLGYTEPEPRDDLGGVDVGRKALILARTMGWKLEMSDVEIEPLYPSHLSSLSVPDFLAALPSLDADYSARHQQAQKEGKVLRYVATLQDGHCNVGLKALDAESPIGRLTGTENMVEYRTAIYKEKGLVVQGSGAGGEVTASGVLADMVELAFTIGKEIEN
jgi:homoserine dehydrogenase